METNNGPWELLVHPHASIGINGMLIPFAMPSNHLKIEAYCILCNTNLPRWNSIEEREASPHADLANVLCFFRLPQPATVGGALAPDAAAHAAAPEASLVTAVTTQYGAPHWALHDQQLRQLVFEANLTVCELDLCNSCSRTTSPANFVHVSCYDLAKQIVPDLSAEDLWRFARLTRPISLAEFLPDDTQAAPAYPPSVGHLRSLPLNGSTSLGQLIADVRKALPLEVERDIVQRSGPLFKPLTDTVEIVGTHSVFLRRRQPLPERQLQLSLPLWDTARIGIMITYIMGEACISDIGARVMRPQWDREIELAELVADPDVFDGIQTAYGTFGVTAIRFLFKDGSMSPWLGEPPRFRRRFQTTKGSLENLRSLSDGFKLVSIKIHSEAEWLGLPHGLPESMLGLPRSLLWNDDAHPMRGYTYSLHDVREPYRDEARHFGFRTGLVLSLQDIRSLTFFCSPHGISSIQPQGGAESHRVGLKMRAEKTVTRTLFFAPGEFIKAIWLIKEKAKVIITQVKDWGPHLLMFTSTGRHLYTGPQELLECSLHISRFDQAGNEQRPPVALFIDPSTSFAGTIRSMGAVFNDEEEMEQPRRRKEIEFILPVKAGDGPIFPAEPNIHTYLTTAYFSKVTCLKKQMRRGRCVGLYIERERDPKRIDPPQILGQWDPACTQGITTIYPAGPGEPEPVEALTFVFAPESQPGAGGRHCVDVLVGRHESIRQPKYISETFPHRLAWWYNQRSDLIQQYKLSTKALRTDPANEVATKLTL